MPPAERPPRPMGSVVMTRSIMILTLALAACNAGPDTEADTANMAAPAMPTNSTADGAMAPTNMAAPTNSQDAPDDVLTLEGLGGLRFGQPVPAGSSFAERGAQISDGCRTVSSPDFPGVYAMVIDDKVRRISVGQRSDVKLVEGIGTGATEAAVTDAFPGFAEEPHKYEDAPAKYLTAPGGSATDPALRFEIGRDGKVSLIHVGLMPELEYVEGCA